MTKPVILTGLRANNDLHIGNYFGALLPLVDMAKNRADDYEINLFVPDLHSFTTPINHSQLQAQIMHNLKLFVAAGLPLDHDNIHIYRQSFVPAHSELTWILDCFTSYGQMARMTQFKDKSGMQDLLSTLETRIKDVDTRNLPTLDKDPHGVIDLLLQWERESIDFEASLLKDAERSEAVSVGLFNYPVLMAADILLYGATYVPVGDDQTQHLEFTRDIAERMNNRFGELFVVPKPVKEQHEFFGSGGAEKNKNHQGLRIKDLQDPSRKMSKSEESDKGVIFLGDEPETAAKKIHSATTDSLGKIEPGNPEQPGVNNLLQIVALATGRPLSDVNQQFAGQTKYGDLKTEAAIAISEFLNDFQEKLSKVDEEKLMAKLERDEAKMNEIADATLLKVQKAVGLR